MSMAVVTAAVAAAVVAAATVTKVKRRSSSAQHNNQTKTKQVMAKVAREKQVAHRSKDEEQWHVMQQPIKN
jgi:hypothetical protein